jgi:GntR family transcriptional regulator
MASFTYLDIADDLDWRIQAGEYLPGTAIPSYRRLARSYGVSVSTVQRALILVRDRGVVAGRQGVGVFAIQQPTVLAETEGRRRIGRARLP